MTRITKLYVWVLDNPTATLSFRDFERLLRASGFTLARTKGSHRQYVHPAIRQVFPVQPEGKDAKRYQVRQLIAMIQTHGLELRDD